MKLKFGQRDTADMLMRYLADKGMAFVALSPCGCWSVRFRTGGRAAHNCGGPDCYGMAVTGIARRRKDWPKDCPCGRMRLLLAESRAAARDGDEALHEKLRRERLAHWKECGK